MTERIQSILNQISDKAKNLHGKLQAERDRNASLISENEELQSKLNEKLAEITALENKLIEQEQRLIGQNEQSSVPVSNSSLGRTQEIDELVKEIEYCISQLRK